MRALQFPALALAACGGDGAGPNDDGSTPSTVVPAELVGTWYHGEVSPSNYYDPSSGHWDNSYGEGLFYTLTPDGHFEWGYRIYTSTYGCNDVAMFWKKGTVTVDPATQSFTVYPTEAILHSTDDCRPEWNYTKQISKAPETVYWGFDDDGYGTTALLLAYASTQPSAFYPWSPGAVHAGAIGRH
jgi:hypothetical protein